MPTGDFSDAYGPSFGFSGSLLFRVVSMIDITGSVGFYRWSDTEEEFGYSYDHSISTIPLLGGIRLYAATGDLSPYVAGEIGFHVMTGKVTANGESASDSESDIGFGAGIGFLLKIGDNLFIDANAKYNSINRERHSIDFLSAMVGVTIGI